nr:hypothetical protein [Candidatus Sigynarchaeota archaeon]
FSRWILIVKCYICKIDIRDREAMTMEGYETPGFVISNDGRSVRLAKGTGDTWETRVYQGTVLVAKGSIDTLDIKKVNRGFSCLESLGM